MTDSFVISGIRLTYDRVDVGTLELASHEDCRGRIEELLELEGVSEATVLQTCNRVEEYVVTESPERGHEVLGSFSGAPTSSVQMDHGESLKHLLRVAAGLESQVLGEDQILGQVREAYAVADECGGIGSILEPAFLKAIHVGERAREETAINQGTVSLGGAAIELAMRNRGLNDRTVVIVGAGEMASTIAKSLPEDVSDVHLINRTHESAAAVESSVDRTVHTHDLSNLPDYLSTADVVFTATASREPVIDEDTASQIGETFIVDMAQPRDVSSNVKAISDVTVQNLDDLRSITDATHEDRKESAQAVEAIVESEYELLLEQYKRQRVDDVISGIYRGAEQIKADELQRALNRLEDIDAHDREILESLVDSLVSRILAVPTESLRDAAGEDDWETIMAAIDLFGPADESEIANLFEIPSHDDVDASQRTPADGGED